MKRLVLLPILLAFTVASFTQLPYKVITVNGEIVATKANVTLENGIEVNSDDNFDFRKPNSRAAMINSERGRVILTEQNAADAFSRAAFAPAMSSVSSRSGAVSSIVELQNIFANKMVIINKLDLQVGADYFPMEEQKFFFIRFTYNSETINKRLPFKGDVMTIDQAELYVVDGKPIPAPDTKEVSLYYHKKTDDQPESVLICTFEPVFMNGEILKAEVKVIVDEFEGQPSDKVLAEVYDYLTSFYGNVDRTHLEQWLKKEFKLNI